MARKETFLIPLPDDDYYLAQSTAAAGTAVNADFSRDGSFGLFGVPAKISFKLDSATECTVTVVYVEGKAVDGAQTTEVLTVSNAAVVYTSKPVQQLVSVTWTLVAGATLDVGYQGYPYIYCPMQSHVALLGAAFLPSYVETNGADGLTIAITKATEGTPAANKIGYESSSECMHYCYPENGSSKDCAGSLQVWFKG